VQRFTYQAMTLDGRRIRGQEDAPSAATVHHLLGAKGLYVLHVEAAAETVAGRRWSLAPRRADLAEAFATLASLLEAGLPIDRALEVAVRGAARRDVAGALEGARARVRQGKPVAEALEEHPKVFPPIAVGMMRMADRGGHLPEAVRRLAQHLAREAELRSRIMSALLYPLVLVGIGAITLVILVGFVLPRFVELLTAGGGELPPATSALLQLAELSRRGWPVAVAVSSFAAILVARERRTAQGRLRIDRLLLRIPVLGALRVRYATVRLSRTVSTLVASGVPLLTAMDVAAGTASDAAVGVAVRRAREAVRRGGALSGALAEQQIFPYLFLRLTEVGEETGRLDALMERAADALEEELKRQIERVVALLEPALIVAFGGVVGFVALAVLQAIYGIHADGM